MTRQYDPGEIINAATYMWNIKPGMRYVGFSGGTDSLAVAHWMMENIDGVSCFHANTGIGIERTREFVRDTCRDYGWPLVEIHAKEDCGQDYEQIVKEHGFPGPPMHSKMYARLKERCVRELIRRTKHRRMDKVMIATGIRHDESAIRAGYAGREINKVGAQIWCNPIYWWTGTDKYHYIKQHDLPTNPVSETLGMSGECLCGAYASPGELALVRIVDPETADRIEQLETEVRACGFPWGWEDKPPKGGHRPEPAASEFMCTDCNKAGRPDQ